MIAQFRRATIGTQYFSPVSGTWINARKDMQIDSGGMSRNISGNEYGITIFNSCETNLLNTDYVTFYQVPPTTYYLVSGGWNVITITGSISGVIGIKYTGSQNSVIEFSEQASYTTF